MDQMIGEIRMFAFSQFVPKGWLKCDGKLYDIHKYEVLFALIGNAFGGTAPQNFAVPNLMGTVQDPNIMYCISIEGMWPARD